jgi:hypothetical protein
MSARLFVSMNFLGLAGVVLVVVLLCVAVLRKWKRGIVFRCMFWFSVTGIAIPIVLYLAWMYFNSHGIVKAEVAIQGFFEWLWPSSIGLMGLEGTGSTVSALSVIAMLILINAGLYGIIGLLVGYLWQVILRFHKEGK